MARARGLGPLRREPARLAPSSVSTKGSRPEREIRADELVLLDTGGYYAEGYATDLTRTFLAGSGDPTAEQRDTPWRGRGIAARCVGTGF